MNWSKKILTEELGLSWQEMLKQEHPLTLPVQSEQNHAHSYQLGLIHGYENCLKNIVNSGLPEGQLPKQPESTFSPSD